MSSSSPWARDVDAAATPGLVEGGQDFYTPAGADRARVALADFTGGAAVIGVLGGGFKCPPAPNETAFMLHDHLTARGVREASTIHLVTPLPKPIPVSDDSSAAILAQLDACDIDYWPEARITHLDPTVRVVHLADGRQLAYDLFLGVPVHRAPAVVIDAGLTDDGWIAVDPATFVTQYPGVYAIGDVTSAPVPRAGAVAEAEAATVAAVIAAGIRGVAVPPVLEAQAACYLEMATDQVGRVEVDLLGGQVVRSRFNPPSEALAATREQYGADRRLRWFGPRR